MVTRISTKFKPQLYTSFAGLNTSRADISMERAEAQPFVDMDNLYCTQKGYLTNESPMSDFTEDQTSVTHIRWFNTDGNVAFYAAKTNGGMSFRATNKPTVVEKVWPRATSVATTVFNGKVIIAGGQDNLYSYDGSEFVAIASPTIKGGRYVAQIQDRLAVAGFDSNPNEITLSMVNNEKVYMDETDVAEASVLKPARFNVQNLIGNNDRIRGLSPFENNKLAVFTNDRVLIYLADQDFGQWALDTRLVVRYGTISHNSIVAVGDEVFFCSRSGIHSLRRSALNGTTVYTTPLSDDIQELYQTLLEDVPDKSMVSANFNPNEGRLHIYFPVNDMLAYRLSGSLSSPKQEGEATTIKWSLSTFAGIACGDCLAGRQLYGTFAGIKTVGAWYSNNGERGPGYAQTPILWHKDLFNPKYSLALVLYASGEGTVFVDAEDETRRQLGTFQFDLPGEDTTNSIGVPLQRQFTKPFSFEYIGVRLRVRIQGSKMIRVFGVGILTKEP